MGIVRGLTLILVRTRTKQLFTPFARTTNYGLKQLTVNGPRIWNALPDYIRNEESLPIFLRNIKIYLLSGYDYLL